MQGEACGMMESLCSHPSCLEFETAHPSILRDPTLGWVGCSPPAYHILNCIQLYPLFLLTSVSQISAHVGFRFWAFVPGTSPCLLSLFRAPLLARMLLARLILSPNHRGGCKLLCLKLILITVRWAGHKYKMAAFSFMGRAGCTHPSMQSLGVQEKVD